MHTHTHTHTYIYMLCVCMNIYMQNTWVGKIFGVRAPSLCYKLSNWTNLFKSKEFSLDSRASVFFIIFISGSSMPTFCATFVLTYTLYIYIYIMYMLIHNVNNMLIYIYVVCVCVFVCVCVCVCIDIKLPENRKPHLSKHFLPMQ